MLKKALLWLVKDKSSSEVVKRTMKTPDVLRQDIKKSIDKMQYSLDELKEYYIKGEDVGINCPSCDSCDSGDSGDRAKIIYGMPREEDYKLKQAIDKKIVTLGGCIINQYKDEEGYTLRDYKYKCNSCGEKFYRERIEDKERTY